jgi:hypothetical protein
MILEVCFRGKRTKAANPYIKLIQDHSNRLANEIGGDE